jgi:hypothetical protein
MAYKYKCPACIKVGNTSLDLARHMMGRGDKIHRDWINSQGLSYAELLGLQMRSFGGEGFHKLAELLEKTSKIDEKDIKMTDKGGTRGAAKAVASDEGEQQRGEG